MPSPKRISDILDADPFTDLPLAADEAHLLVNREEIKERIGSVVQSAFKGFPQNMALLGEDGTGKTSLLNFSEAKAKLHSGFFVSHLDVVEGTTIGDVVKTLVRDLLNQVQLGLGSSMLSLVKLGREVTREELQKRLAGIEIAKNKRIKLGESLLNVFQYSRSITETRSSPEDIVGLLDLLQSAFSLIGKPPKAVMLLFDEGQYVATSQAVSLLQQMRLLFQRKPYMLILGGSLDLFQRLSEVEPTFGNLFSEQNRFRLEPLTRTDVAELLARRLELVRKAGRHIDPFELDCVETLRQLAEGNPRYVVRMASASLTAAREEGRVTPVHIEQAGIQIIREMGRDRFDRLRSEEQELVLTIARYQPLNFTAVQKALSTPIDLSTVSRKIRSLEDRGYVWLEPRGNEKRCRLRRAVYEYATTIL
jgi:Cdc6-like AAA superfamily ATPase